jgi:predicted RNA-binding protein with PUA-like domain
MNFLIDTNIVIPLEPASKFDLEINTKTALKFHNLCTKSGNNLYIHPEITVDIGSDKDAERKALRRTLITRYHVLESPPLPTILDSSIISPAKEGSNSWVDNCLLAALQGDLADYLVSEDIGIHKKAKKIGLDSRVLLLSDAIELLQDLFDKSPPSHPIVSTQYVYEIDTNDPIFESLRADYGSIIFEKWLRKCKTEHRQAYVVRSPTGELAGILIWKPEESLPNGKKGKVLKICTFKVSDMYGGNRIGELLLKPLFEYTEHNKYQFSYFTAFPKQTQLIAFANDFGFFEIENRDSPEEIALCKKFEYSREDEENLSPLEFHIKFGPRIASFENNKSFVVPIRPKYHLTLFPELGPIQTSIIPFQLKPCGNAIRKAYICNAMIKKIRVGDNLFFYRSQDISAITSVGIVEDIVRSRDASEIARFVGKRTVYPFSEIEELCRTNEVLAILFRMVKAADPYIRLETLKKNVILKAQPQSITELKETAIQWLRQHIEM